VAPLAESVPPQLYGGTERVVHNLTEQLVRDGHDVTLFASGDSRTSARLVAAVPRALRLNPKVENPLPYTVLQLEQVRRRAEEFDVIHFHLDFVHFPLCRQLAVPTVTTQHGKLDLPDIEPVFDEFNDLPQVSISNAQRAALPHADWRATVYHGLPPRQCPYNPQPAGDYLAFVGRISPEKGPDRAIEIARRAGMKLKIIAKVDRADDAYFREVVEPLLSDPCVEFLGEHGDVEKGRILGNAKALLFPIDWPEPFGLVLIESMSCGTPVIAWDRGSVPEIVDPGVNGFIVDSIEQAVDAVGRVDELSRAVVRASFERRFSAQRMARDYAAVYRSLAAPEPAIPKSAGIDM